MSYKQFNFEKKIEELQENILQLENDNLNLDKSIEIYKNAVNISKELFEYLEIAKGKINILNNELEESFER